MPKARKVRKSKEPKAVVISFRITKKQNRALKTEFQRETARGCRTPKQFAAKILIDFLYERLGYANPEHRHYGIEDFKNGN